MEADLGAVDEARERGLLVEKPVGDVELEEDHAEEEQRRLDEMCQELILEALSSSLEERLTEFEMCREIILEEMIKGLTAHAERSDQKLKEVAKRPVIGRVERGRSDITPNLGRKQKWSGQPEVSKEPAKKRGRPAKEMIGSGKVKFPEESYPERRRSLRHRVSNSCRSGDSLVEEPTCKNLMTLDGDVVNVMKKDVNHNSEPSDSSAEHISKEYRSVDESLKSPFHIQCPACTHNSTEAAQFEKHVDIKHGARAGRLRMATKCCCSLHTHVCRAFAGSLLNKGNKEKLARGVGGVSRPDTPEERSARATLFRHQLMLNMNHNLLCSLCIRFANSHLVDAREEEEESVTEKGELDEVGLEERSQECLHKEEEKKRRDSEFSWEFGRALEVQVERLSDKELKSWRASKEDAIVPGSQEVHKKSRSDTSEDEICEGGERLKQLLSMEANLKTLLDQGDLVQEERESLARMHRLIQEQ